MPVIGRCSLGVIPIGLECHRVSIYLETHLSYTQAGFRINALSQASDWMMFKKN